MQRVKDLGRRLLAWAAALAIMTTSMPSIALAEEGDVSPSTEVVEQISSVEPTSPDSYADVSLPPVEEEIVDDAAEEQPGEPEVMATVNDDGGGDDQSITETKDDTENAESDDNENASTETESESGPSDSDAETAKEEEDNNNNNNTEETVIPAEDDGAVIAPVISDNPSDENDISRQMNQTVVSDTVFSLKPVTIKSEPIKNVVTINATRSGIKAGLLGASSGSITSKSSENVTISGGTTFTITFTNKKQSVTPTPTQKPSATPTPTPTPKPTPTPTPTPVPKGNLSITKTDADTGEKLAGAVFTVKNSAGTVVATITTNANGVATATGLTIGSYTVTESTPPTGYNLSTTSSKNVTVSANNTASVSFENKKITGNLKVQKKDADNGSVLAGAKFVLRNSSNASIVGGAVVANANGIAEWNNVPYGDYILEEVEAPPAHQLAAPVNVQIRTQNTTVTLDFKDKAIYGSIRIKKNDENGKGVAGAKFGLYSAPDASARALSLSGTVLDFKTTNSTGVAVWDNIRYGTYYVREEEAPAGYIPDTQFYGPFEIREQDKVIPVDIVNYKYAEVEFPVVKHIEGAVRPTRNETFTFTLTPVDGAPAAPRSTVTITNEGTASFGKITFEEAGTYRYTVRETPGNSAGFEYDSEEKSVIVIVSKKSGESQSLEGNLYFNGHLTDTLEFNNSYAPLPVTLSIPVKKTITGNARPSQKETFEFTLTGLENAPMPLDATVRISDEGTKSFMPITFTAPGTYRYTVAETKDSKNGYTYDETRISVVVTVVDNNGVLQETHQINGGNNAYAEFTNQYHPVAAKLSIPVSKTIEGDERPDSKETFRFTITPLNGAPAPASTTINIVDEGRAYFPEITFTSAGNYSYSVKETSGSAAGYTYDSESRTVNVRIVDVNGTLTATWTCDNELVDAVPFKNQYHVTPVDVVLNVNKTVGGNDRPADKETFMFQLTSTAANAPMPTNNVVYIRDEGTASFPALHFTKPDEYTYTVIEINGNKVGYTYDATIKTITVRVVNDNSVLRATTYVNGVESTTVSFDNTYVPLPAKLSIPVSKSVDGHERVGEGELFQFTISTSNNAPMPETATIEIRDVGTKDFGEITYTKSGTYNYTVKEVQGNAQGYTYDGTNHQIVVTVTDKNGQLEAEWTDNGQIVDAVAFTNIYTPLPTEIEIPIRKIIDGDTPEDKVFTFKLNAQDNAPASDNPTVTTVGPRTNKFGKINFDSAGTYAYTINEVSGADEGYTYDNSQHVVTVRVVDDAGQLRANMKVDNLDADAVDFTNTYVPTPVSLKIPVRKVVTGADRDPSQKKTFWFVIDSSNEDTLPYATRVAITDEGEALFGSMVYTAAGTYNYTIREERGVDAGYTYDESIRNISVVVRDRGGYLEASWTMNARPVTEVVFTNTYAQQQVELEIPVSKSVDGSERPAEKETFEFTIDAQNGAPTPVASSVNITDAGRTTFGKITFTKPGTYTYVVRETAGSSDGYTYDRTQHTVVVTVRDHNGVLEANWTCDGSVVTEVSFSNSYKPMPTSLRIPVKKTIEGEARTTKKDFTFELASESENAPIPSNRFVTIRDEGTASFGAINFTESGVYTYSIRENWDDLTGYDFDNSVRTIVVTVVDNHGRLEVASWTCDGTQVSTVEFVNTYVPKPVEVIIPVEKRVTGDNRPEQKETFEFTINPSGTAPASEKALITITDNGTASFGKIVFDKPGTYIYTVIETAGDAEGYTYDTTEHTVRVIVEDVNGTLTASWTDNGINRESVIFNNKYKPTPTTFEIPVIKTITGHERPDRRETFRFHVSNINGAPAITPDNITITDEGEARFAPITFTTAGVYMYTVHEMIGNAVGYTYDENEHTILISVVDNGGELEVESWLVDGRNAEKIAFENKYQPETVSLSIPVAKEVTGNERPGQKETFIFTMDAINDAPLPTRSVIYIMDSGFSSFDNIQFSKAGTYQYTITEKQGSADGYTYDSTVMNIEVTVTDNNGRLSAKWTCNGSAIDTVKFVNQYAPVKTTVTIPVIKTVSGNERPDEKQTFAFVIANSGTTSNPMPAETTVYVTDEGNAEFGPIEFTEAGTYNYAVRETVGNAGGYTYDQTVHTVVIEVEDLNGRLVANWTDNGRNATAIEFENLYAPAHAELELPVRKLLTGHETPTDKNFTFQITTNTNAPLPENNKVTVVGAGEGSFDKITYLEAGTYLYYVSEIRGTDAGYEYDAVEHAVSVVVTDNDGVLTAEWTVDGAEKDAVEFTNTYTAKPVDLTIPVSKSIEGDERPDEKETFVFTLTGALGAPETEKNEISIVDEGKEYFGTLTFTTAGTYRYSVKEVMGDSNGYTYDGREHRIVVTVVDNEGQLEASWTDNGQIVEEVQFLNTYEVEETSLVLPIRKVLSGQDTPADKTFTFRIDPQDMAPAPAERTTTTVGASDGEFAPITFTKSGIYAYTVYEIEGDDEGYTYDNAQHVVIVRVTDIGGQLEATYKVDGRDVDVIEFSNTYVPQPVSIKLPVRKIVEGHDRVEYLKKIFWFEINAGESTPEDTLPSTTRVSIMDNGEAEFGTMYFTEAGIYRYTITEDQGVDLGYSYDAEPKTVIVTVVDNDGSLEAEWKLWDDAEATEKTVDAVEFLNQYAPVEVTAKIPVRKTVTGNDRPFLSPFKFVIEDAFSAYAYLHNNANGGSIEALIEEIRYNNPEPMPETRTVTIDELTTGTFGPITYNATGAYYYHIYEVNDQIPGYDYSAEHAFIKVVVADNNGKLEIASQKAIMTTNDGQFNLDDLFNEDADWKDVAEFVNQYTPEPVELVLPVQKSVDGNDRPEDKETFVFTLYGLNGAPMPDEYQVSIADEGTAQFTPIKYTDAGRYEYILREEVGESLGYTYDRTEHRLVANVTDIGGALEVEWTDNGEPVEAVAFVNKYVPVPVDVTIPVSKSITGDVRPDEKETFEFTITPNGVEGEGAIADQPVPANDKVTIVDAGKTEFGKMHYEYAGVYTYTVEETMGDAHGYTYDTTEHQIVVTVTDNHGQLEAVWTDNGEIVEEVPFENNYDATDAVLIIPVVKKITGDARPEQKETFVFTLRAPYGAPLPETTTVQITDEGEASFGEITYDKAGIYRYTLTETVGNAEGYIYDTANHVLVVRVIDDHGTLTADWTDNSNRVDAVEFVNNYLPTSTTLVLPVEKQITGNVRPTALRNTFQFVIESIEGAPAPGYSTVSVRDEGRVEFPAITFTHAGTYTYKVYEQDDDSNDSYAFDLAPHTIVVTVEDKGGHLEATWTDNDEPAAEGHNILFVNAYKPKSVNVIIPVSKDIVGNERPDEKETFEFEIVAAGMEIEDREIVTSQPMPENTKIKVTDKGRVEFGAMTYEGVGTYTYTIKETMGDSTGYTYDTTEHTIVVAVTDNGGRFVADWTCDGDHVQTVPFENGYHPVTTMLQIPVAKTVTGNERPADKETFVFELMAESQNAPIPENRFATITDEGETLFDAITYDKAGTYTYSVREVVNNSKGYTYDRSIRNVVVTVTDEAGELKATWSVDGEPEADVQYENNYTPAPVDVIIPVSKDVEGNERPDEKETFEFVISANGVEGEGSQHEQPMPANDKVTIVDAGKTEFGAIHFTETGVYTYTVKETMGDAHGYTYDTTEHQIVVTVTDNHGTLEAEWTDNGEIVEEVPFLNNYNPDDAQVVIPVNKTVTGDPRPEQKETFVFKISGIHDAPMPDSTDYSIPEPIDVYIRLAVNGYDAQIGDEFTITALDNSPAPGAYNDGTTGQPTSLNYAVINVTEPGYYTYLISGVNAITGETLDGVTENVYVYVVKVDGQLVPVISYGEEIEHDDSEKDDSVISITDTGSAEFAPITYDTAGTYVYTVSEIVGGADGYTYDRAVHTIIVTVTDKNGVLAATYTIDDQEKETVDFVNNYLPQPTKLVIPVEKKISGNVRPNAHWNSFKFTLTPADGEPESELPTVFIRDEGVEKFGKIVFAHAGTYHYNLVEEKEDDRGYTYDDTVHDITVTVTDMNGRLNATWTDNGTDADAEYKITFENTYIPEPATLIIPVSKSVDGHERPDEKETFHFTIEGTGMNVMDAEIATEQPMPERTTVDITDAGRVTFGEMAYVSAGTYTYVVKETQGDSTGYTYDTTEHVIKVTVTDVGGKLIAAWTDNENVVNEVSFKNTYYPELVEVELPVSKELTGNPTPEDKVFIFEITTPDNSPLPDHLKALISGKSQGTENGKFESIVYDHTGEYHYFVNEIRGFDMGYTYSTAEHEITVIITDNHGQLEAKWLDNGEEVDSIHFINRYEPVHAKLSIPVAKDITGNERPDEKETFEFTIEAKEMDTPNMQLAEQPMPEEEKISITDVGYESFGEIDFPAAGTYTYVVKETQGDATGYTYDTTEATITVTVVDNDGTLEATWTSDGNVVNEVQFVNNYKPVPAELELPIQKDLSGQTTPTDKTFVFSIEAMDGAPAPENLTVSALGAEVVKFDKITYEKAGTYAYVIRENEGSDVGYTYDKAQHIVIVTVTDVHGELQTSWKMDGRYVDTILFSNIYIPLPTSLIIPVTKTVTGNEREEYLKKTFVFTITGEDEAPMPVHTTVSILDEGNAEFDSIIFTEAGEYNYTIAEVKGVDRGYTYDETKQKVTVNVVDNDGKLEATWTLNGSAAEAVDFENEYKPLTVTIGLPVEKIIDGYARPTGEEKEFTFKLEAVDASNPMPVSSEIVITDEGTNDYVGMTYTKTGEYLYDLYEVAGNAAGYTYDNEKIRVVVTVIDHNGQLEANWTVDGKTPETIKFRNEYIPAPTSIQIPVKKLLTGNETPEDKTFLFELLTTGNAPVPNNNLVEIEGAGEALFDAINYEVPGTFRYIVREVRGSDRGYTYDTALKQIVVTVTDRNAQLNAEITFVNSKDASNGAATFTNKYIPDEVSLEIPVRKFLTGTRVVHPMDFTFQIEPVNADNPMPMYDTVTVNGAHADRFDPMTYTEAGEYEYLIRELPAEYEEDYVGYTFDENVHHVTVKITDDDGRLKATWTDDGQMTREVRFYNDYTPIPTTVKLPIEKEIFNQKPAQASEFRFVIEKDNAAYPDPVNTEITITGEDTFIDAFDVTFTKAGKYVYHVSEVDEGKTGYTYDKRVYDVNVVVVDKFGELVAETVITYVGSNGNSVHMAREMLFSNEYVPIPTDLKLPVNKVISGNHDRPERFKKTFVFFVENGTMEDHSGSLTEAEMPTPEETFVFITDEGTTEFGNIHFTRAGVYTYVVTEAENIWTGYTFDKTVYMATVTVVDDWGYLRASWEATDEEGNGYGADITFDNEYIPIPVDLAIPAEKAFTGNNRPTEKTFTFVLTAKEMTGEATKLDSIPMPEDAIGNIKTINVVGPQTVDFGTITFTYPGVYTYTIREKKGIETGYTYDEHEYVVTVTVTDNDGRLEEVWNVDEITAEAVVVTNDYTPIPVDDYITVTKFMTGEIRPDSEKIDFAFKIEPIGIEGEGAKAPQPMPESDTILIHDYDTKSFGSMHFTYAGVYTYRVYELDANDRDYTCDKTVYTVTITVVDNDGRLESTKAYATEDGPANNVRFSNHYYPYRGRIVLDKKGLQFVDITEVIDENGYRIQKPVFEDKYLEGATFEIYAAETIYGKDGSVWFEKDQLADTVTTTANGNDSSKDLPFGKYYVIETSAPVGYDFSSEPVPMTLAFKDLETVKVDFKLPLENDYLKIELTVDKEMEDMLVTKTEDGMIRQTITNVPGEGFIFGIFADDYIYGIEHSEDCVIAPDMLVATAKTNAEGKALFDTYLPHGKYYVKEIKARDGWKLDETHHRIRLDATKKAENEPVIRVLLDKVHDDIIWYPITLTKTDITGEVTVPGAVIEVYDESGKIIYRAVTDENGNIPDIPVTPGKYTFKEVLAPEGYELNVAIMTFRVTGDGTIIGDNAIRDDYTRVVLKKVGEDGEPLVGVEFSMMKDDGSVLFTAISDENGLVTFEKIPYGEFTIVESKPLVGYIPNGTKINVNVNGTFINPEVPAATLVNRVNEVKVLKVDKNGNILPGATFGLFDQKNEQIMTAVSDNSGFVTFRKIPYGTYEIRETIAPDGYLVNKIPVKITIDENYRNQDAPLATVVDQLRQIKYIKVDTSGKYLEGVEFSLINAKTNEVVEVVTSDENGVFVLTKFDYGDWIVRETKVPEGFNQMEDVILHVDENWVEPEPFTCVNIPDHYEFKKIGNKGNPLPGVKFSVEDEEGNKLGEYISDENGIVKITGLKPGTYIIRETETVKGYMLTDEVIKVVVDENFKPDDELYVLINYQHIQTGVGFTMTPLMWAGAAVALLAIESAVVLLIKKKGKKEKKTQE